MRVFFQTRLGNILIYQKFSGTWESDFNELSKSNDFILRNTHMSIFKGKNKTDTTREDTDFK